MNPRRITVLVIHDSELEQGFLRSDDLELFPIAGYRGASMTYLSSWEDHVQFWRDVTGGAHGGSAPDLLLIDANFAEDRTAPGVAPALDPRGLLHGLVFLSRALGAEPGRPFGFRVYSQDVSRLKEHPYGVTFFGLLAAMAGQVPPFSDVGPSGGLHPWINNHMVNLTRGGEPKDAWQDALTMYRERVVNLAADNIIAIDRESALDCQAHARAVIAGSASGSAPRAIKWLGTSGEDSVLLSSLFADCRTGGSWDSAKLQEVEDEEKFLHQLVEFNWRDRDYEPSRQLLDHAVGGSPMPEDAFERFEKEKLGKWQRGRNNILDRIRGLAALMWAIVLNARERENTRIDQNEHVLSTPDAAALLTDLDLDDVELNRAVQHGLGRKSEKLTPGEMLSRMKSGRDWPFDPAAFLCVRQYLREIGVDQKWWPPCLR